jgi:hypothetical protein
MVASVGPEGHTVVVGGPMRTGAAQEAVAEASYLRSILRALPLRRS